jgi:hypothetical protein
MPAFFELVAAIIIAIFCIPIIFIIVGFVVGYLPEIVAFCAIFSGLFLIEKKPDFVFNAFVTFFIVLGLRAALFAWLNGLSKRQ